MQIKHLRIHHYRQFIEEAICLEKEITFLAGANNSGKTSIIELLSILFDETPKKLSVDDMPVKILKDLAIDIGKKLENIFQKGVEEKKVLDDISKIFVNSENSELTESELLKRIREECIRVEIEVGYGEWERIERFSPFLMDLDEQTYGFYFVVMYEFIPSEFIRAVKDRFSRYERYFKYVEVGASEKEKTKRVEQFMNLMNEVLQNSFKVKYYYGDKNYQNLQSMEENQFEDLFYFRHISANRDIPDEKRDKQKTISIAMMEFLGHEQWEKIIDNIPEQILQIIQENDIENMIKEKSLDKLSEVITSMNATNGGREETLIVSPEVSDKSLKDFLIDISQAKYKIGDFYFGESSQGLGYTNMIYMHLQFEKYVNGIDMAGLPKVNFFVVEEPEAHMHPQMQKVFIQHLMKNYNGKKIQGIVTTHSSEVVKLCDMKSLRVIRSNGDNKFTKRICDIRKFFEIVEEKTERKNFYNLLYSINFADIIFADKIIMFEGDTERMYLKEILKLGKYEKLAKQYIALVQVGGAYAHWYKEIVTYLNIKTLILTDLDYAKEVEEISSIKESISTNGAIKSFYYDTQEFIKRKDVCVENKEEEKEDKKEELKINALYDWKSKGGNKFPNGLMINFQGPKDGYTRTLEEAMLAKKFNLTIENKYKREEWKKYRKDSKLLFSVPGVSKKQQEDKERIEKEELSLRQIVNVTSDKKTDFMYSVILQGYVEAMLPNYIEEGLQWLMD